MLDVYKGVSLLPKGIRRMTAPTATPMTVVTRSQHVSAYDGRTPLAALHPLFTMWDEPTRSKEKEVTGSETENSQDPGAYFECHQWSGGGLDSISAPSPLTCISSVVTMRSG